MPVLEELDAMSEGRFLALYEALAVQGFGPLDHEVAKVLRFRPQAIRKLPMEKRARQARRIMLSGKKGDLCYELFGSYLVRTQKELVTGFLDATGVAHEDGMIEDIDAGTPDAGKLDAAVADLDAKHDADDVTLYMALCAEQWPESKELGEVWEKRRGASKA